MATAGPKRCRESARCNWSVVREFTADGESSLYQIIKMC